MAEMTDPDRAYDEQGRPAAEDPMERIRAGGHKGGLTGGVRGGQRIHEMAAMARGEDPSKVGKYSDGGKPTKFQEQQAAGIEPGTRTEDEEGQKYDKDEE
eukprot:jgi/Chlat1/8055/Chrsp73S07520